MIDAIRLRCYSRRPGECSHRTVQAAAIDTVEDITATHSDIGIAEHIACTTTTIDTAITD